MLAHAYHFTSFRRVCERVRAKDMCIPKASLYPVYAAAVVVVFVIVCGATAAGWKISPKGKRITRMNRIPFAGAVVAC